MESIPEGQVFQQGELYAHTMRSVGRLLDAGKVEIALAVFRSVEPLRGAWVRMVKIKSCRRSGNPLTVMRGA